MSSFILPDNVTDGGLSLDRLLLYYFLGDLWPCYLYSCLGRRPIMRYFDRDARLKEGDASFCKCACAALIGVLRVRLCCKTMYTKYFFAWAGSLRTMLLAVFGK